MAERFNVRPANAAATIFDPELGDNLPADGRDVDRTPYWVGLELRGEVIASDIKPVPEPASATDDSTPSDPAPKKR